MWLPHNSTHQFRGAETKFPTQSGLIHRSTSVSIPYYSRTSIIWTPWFQRQAGLTDNRIDKPRLDPPTYWYSSSTCAEDKQACLYSNSCNAHAHFILGTRRFSKKKIAKPDLNRGSIVLEYFADEKPLWTSQISRKIDPNYCVLAKGRV